MINLCCAGMYVCVNCICVQEREDSNSPPFAPWNITTPSPHTSPLSTACLFMCSFPIVTNMPDYSCHDASEKQSKRKESRRIWCEHELHQQMTLTADRSSDVGSAACTCNTPIWPVLVNSPVFGDFACLPFMASNDFGFDFDFFSSAYFFLWQRPTRNTQICLLYSGP